MADSPDTKGFSDDQIHYLVGHAQQFHGPSEFDKQVQWHLNKATGVHDPTAPPDWENPESDYQQGQLHEQQALSNISEGSGPDTTPAPKSTLPSKAPDWSDLPGS
jgi:hypothetical protein